VVIVETEIWPNCAYNLHKRNIPLVLINGRISPKSFNNYRKVAFFTTHILRFFSYFLMQSEIDATRIMQMGAEEAKVEIAGNLKYDIKPDLTPEDIIELKEKLCIKESDNIVIAGSTHNGEESIILDTFLHLKENLPNLKLIMVPRHPERYDEVIKVFKLKEVSFCRRSQKETFDKASIMLLDTMGELSTFYAIADVAFVGGSIIEKGGHNPLEPAVYSVPVVVGPHTFNFLDITKYMVQAGGAIQVQSKDDLYSVFFDLLTDQATYARAQKACSLLFEKNRGATDKTLHCLYQYL
jgi:3-deoxy-D-manno-octulosonic-acid transferase